MVVISMLPHAEIGGNDHREDAPQFKSHGSERVCQIYTNVPQSRTN